MGKYCTAEFVNRGNPWKRVARRLRSKYRTELAMERAAHNATKQALIAMVRGLADSIESVRDVDWDELAPPKNKLS